MRNDSFVCSPLTNKKAIFVKAIDKQFLIREYKRQVKIDVKNILSNKEIGLYQCKDSGLQFFYPFTVTGDGEFYSQLQRYEWYYSPWKWEHEYCKNYIKNNHRVMEVGCATGDFIYNIKHSIGAEVVGLELNPKAIEVGVARGMNVSNESLAEHSLKFCEYYDIVCSFQVVEHIADIRSFLENQIKCIKKGGKLIVSVPNNNSFIKIDEGGILNFPPHHMGRWDSNSLMALEKIFGIKLLKMKYEPLQEAHFEWYFNSMLKRLYGINIMLGRIIEKLFRPIYRPILKIFKPFIKGHSVVAVFQK